MNVTSGSSRPRTRSSRPRERSTTLRSPRPSLVALIVTTVLALSLVATASARLGQSARAARIPFEATLTAPTHRPKANTKWYYTVRVKSLGGKPIKARITVQIKDPLGGLHPVLYANTKKKLVNWPIDGRFRDYVIWPRSSAIGISLVLRVTVEALAHERVLTSTVTPRA